MKNILSISAIILLLSSCTKSTNPPPVASHDTVLVAMVRYLPLKHYRIKQTFNYNGNSQLATM